MKIFCGIFIYLKFLTLFNVITQYCSCFSSSK